METECRNIRFIITFYDAKLSCPKSTPYEFDTEITHCVHIDEAIPVFACLWNLDMVKPVNYSQKM